VLSIGMDWNAKSSQNISTRRERGGPDPVFATALGRVRMLSMIAANWM